MTMMMNILTGSVDTIENWKEDAAIDGEWDFDEAVNKGVLVEVKFHLLPEIESSIFDVLLDNEDDARKSWSYLEDLDVIHAHVCEVLEDMMNDGDTNSDGGVTLCDYIVTSKDDFYWEEV